jgi:hypothetical protein
MVQPFLPQVHGSQCATSKAFILDVMIVISIEAPLRLRVVPVVTESIKTSTPFPPHLHATLGLRSLRFGRLSALSDSDSKHESIDTRRYN